MTTLIDTPPVTILVPTFRLGGIDCLAKSIGRQTYPRDRMQVVLVDALADRRWKPVREYWRDHGPSAVSLYHLEVPGFDWRQSYARAFNVGLKAATGEIVIVWPDYTLAPPLCVESHVRLLDRGGMRCASLGIVQYGNCPIDATCEGFVRPADLAAYRRLVESLPPDSPLWTSLFLDDPDEMARAGLIWVGPPQGHDPRLSRLNGPVTFTDVLLKNEAFPTAALLEIGGADEIFDGRPDYVDTDVGLRLQQIGIVPVLDKGNEVIVVSPHGILPCLAWSVSFEDQHAIFDRRCRAVQQGERIVRAERGIPEVGAKS